MTEVLEKLPSRALREGFARDYLVPLARALFELEPRCQSMLVTVGQYWCDEATDAVHCHQIACLDRDPEWPAAAQARPGALGDPDPELFTQHDGEPWDLQMVQDVLLEKASEKAFGKRWASTLDDNTDMIVAFASYCKEVSDQEQPDWVSHVPYAVVRRPEAGGEPKLEVIGQMYRPQWEDRWDVLEHDGIMLEAEVNDAAAAPETAAPESQPPKPAKTARLDGRTLLALAFVIAGLTYLYLK
jgi:hypothetical protein